MTEDLVMASSEFYVLLRFRKRAYKLHVSFCRKLLENESQLDQLRGSNSGSIWIKAALPQVLLTTSVYAFAFAGYKTNLFERKTCVPFRKSVISFFLGRR